MNDWIYKNALEAIYMAPKRLKVDLKWLLRSAYVLEYVLKMP